MSTTYHDERTAFLNPALSAIPEKYSAAYNTGKAGEAADWKLAAYNGIDRGIIRVDVTYDGESFIKLYEAKAGTTSWFDVITHGKSGVKISALANKIFNTDGSDSWINRYSALVILKDIGDIDLNEYNLFVFDSDGFKISTFKNSTMYKVNGTVYVLLKRCTMYEEAYDNTEVFASTLHIVLMKRFNKNKYEYAVPSLYSVDSEGKFVKESAVDLTNLQTLAIDATAFPEFTKYPAACYQPILWIDLLFLSSLTANGISFYGTPDGSDVKFFECTYTNATTTAITDSDKAVILAYLKDHYKNSYILWDKYTCYKEDDKLICSPKVPTVSDLNLSYSVAMGGITGSDGYVTVKLIGLSPSYTKFYIGNRMNSFNAEFSYYAKTSYIPLTENVYGIVNLCNYSGRSTLTKDQLTRSFDYTVPATPEKGKIYGNLLYIPLETYHATVNDSEKYDTAIDKNSHEHAYPVMIEKPEDVAVWIDGVKLTPYADYLIMNKTMIGNDYPTAYIVCSPKTATNTDSSTYSVDTLARNFPCPSVLDEEHYVQVVSLPPKTVDTYSNFYIGPEYGDFYNSTGSRVVSEAVDILESNGILDSSAVKYYPFVSQKVYGTSRTDRSGTGTINSDYSNNYYRLSALSINSLMMFHGGRYIPPTSEAYSRIVTDFIAAFRNMKTPFNVELYTYFDPSTKDTAFMQQYENTEPYMTNMLSVMAASQEIYLSAYWAATGGADSGKLSNDASATVTKYAVAFNHLYNLNTESDISPIELWLKNNTDLTYATDNSTDSSVRVPATVQTAFDASGDLSNQGYTGNISVNGSDTDGLADRTETNDTSNNAG